MFLAAIVWLSGGGTRNRTRVRFQNQIVTHGSFGRGFDDLAEPPLGATSKLQRSSTGDLTPGRTASACDANPQITQTTPEFKNIFVFCTFKS